MGAFLLLGVWVEEHWNKADLGELKRRLKELDKTGRGKATDKSEQYGI